MRLSPFVRKNRPHWQRLEELVNRMEKRGVTGTSREFIQELSLLYRATTADLAFAQTYFPGTTILLFLNQLVARAHNQIYRAHRFNLTQIGHLLRNEVPNAVRQHFSAVVWAGIIFSVGLILGMATIQFDERAASLVLPNEMIDSINAGQMWTGNIFSVVPAPITTTQILTNNLSVALFCFIGGISFGLITGWILFFNGFLLGAVWKLCANHGLMNKLLEFISGHGVIEISSILVSGAAGLVLAQALLYPGHYARLDALKLKGRSALKMTLACAPVLLVAALIETFISPSLWPVWFKVSLGLTLGALFWSYLLWTGRKPLPKTT